MKIAIASAPYPASIKDGLYWIDQLCGKAREQQAEIICFPESYIPGYTGLDFVPEVRTQKSLQDALGAAGDIAVKHKIAIILPMDWYGPEGLLNVAQVISDTGEVLGYQTKNQLDPSEDNTWVPGTERQLFTVKGLTFGIVICHEGFRYPESVRWAARRGASVVFHPQLTGSNTAGVVPVAWGSMDNPYYEKAMMMRALENTIYFASCNYATRFPESASSVIAPDGTCVAYQAYGEIGIIVADIDPGLSTGLLAKRFKQELY